MNRRHRDGPYWVALLFRLAVVVPVVAGLAIAIYVRPDPFLSQLGELAFWAAILAIVELFPVPARRGLQLSLGFPIKLGLAILYPPVVAAAVSFIGSFDPREIKRTRPMLLALFDRSQMAASVLVGGSVFHGLASVYPPAQSPWYVLIPAVLLATASDYTVNVSIVALYMRVVLAIPIRAALADLRMGSPLEFLLSYLGLSFVGAVIARLYLAVELWAVVAFILPLVFARQMFFRTAALEEATRELKDRERVLRALSNRMAEERHDERMQIAGYLHDDLAQMLFRLTLQVEMAKKRLALKDPEGVMKNLEGITASKQQASDMVRALIRDLHRSPIGRAGLGEAITSFAIDASRDFPTRIEVDVPQVTLPPPIQLLIYQIAREATMNALKHAEAKTIRIMLREAEDGVELTVSDDGRGFDPESRPPEGHYGFMMMRERALVAGGTFSAQSAIGKGTTIRATFPRVWVEEATAGGDAAREPARAPIGSTTGPVGDSLRREPVDGEEHRAEERRTGEDGGPDETPSRDVRPGRVPA